MRDISDIEATQIALFASGCIPYRRLCTRQGIQLIQETFSFREFTAGPGSIEILFEGGLVFLPGEEHTAVIVSRLQISDRRIVLTVGADSKTASTVFEMVRKLLRGQDPEGRLEKAKVICFRQETNCSVTLDIGWERFLNPAMSAFLTGPLKEAISDKEADAALSGVNLRFNFSYTIKDNLIGQYGILLAPKNLVIEPLANTPLGEHRFTTSSPTDSDTHLKILRDLETVLAPPK